MKSEIAHSGTEASIEFSTETILRKKLSHIENQALSETMHKKIKDVAEIIQKYPTQSEISKKCQDIWEKLEASKEGQVLLENAGGKQRLQRLMDKGMHKFINQVAHYSEKGKRISGRAVGRNVHRMGELFRLRKSAGEVVKGKLLVENPISYVDSHGSKHSIRCDYLRRMGDGRIRIGDIKPIHLDHFEATPEGQKWVEWAKKTIGNDFRERIRDGESPFFCNHTIGGIPPEIRDSLQDFLIKSAAEHKRQFQKYRFCVAEAENVDVSKVGVSISPYFRFE
jgi:hypothetical protein